LMRAKSLSDIAIRMRRRRGSKSRRRIRWTTVRSFGAGNNHSAWRLVGILVMDLLDVLQRGKEDVEELGVEVLPSMFGHKIDGVIEGEGGLVNPSCGEGIEGIGD